MAATNDFATFAPALDSPGMHAAPVTPDDNTDLTKTARALYVGGTGDVVVITVNAETVTFKACPVGTILPVCVNRVKSTGTTATNLVAIW